VYDVTQNLCVSYAKHIASNDGHPLLGVIFYLCWQTLVLADARLLYHEAVFTKKEGTRMRFPVLPQGCWYAIDPEVLRRLKACSPLRWLGFLLPRAWRVRASFAD
jgi:hypothetical protein